jgi:kinesin family protein 5
LRFGVSAKNIKNKPKINRELTVAELQLLLEKAEVKIADKDKQVIRLEEYIKNELKAKLPLGNAIESTPTEISIEDVEDERFKTI